MTVVYLPATTSIHDEAIRQNFEYIESHAVFKGFVAVTGSRGGNAAVASLLTTLASAGLITDNTTP